MAQLKDLNAKLRADIKDFSSKMQNAERRVAKFSKKMQNTGRRLSVGLTLPVVAFGVKSAQAFDKQDKAMAQVRQGLESTKNASGKTFEELTKMASDLQKNTLFGDEEILQGATAQLLTFTNIAGKEFDKTQQIVLDVATRLDGDLKSTAIMLGKALNDPVKNLSALGRAGIQFTESQIKTVKSLVATNRMAEAQSMILAELEKQYGGSAEAAAKAGMGPIKQLINVFGDFQEAIGKVIIEGDGFQSMIESVKNKLSEWTDKFKQLSPESQKLIFSLAKLAAALGPIIFLIAKLTQGIMGLGKAFAKLGKKLSVNPYLLIAAAIAAVTAALVIFINKSKELSGSASAMKNATIEATRAISEEKTKVELLTKAVNDETKSKDERLKALNELKRISPSYFGNLDIEKSKTEDLVIAARNYTDELLRSAKAKAAGELMAQNMVKVLDLQNKVAEEAGELVPATNAIAVAQNLNTQRKINGYLKEIKTIEEQNKAYEKMIISVGDVIDNNNKLNNNIDRLADNTEKKAEKMSKAIDLLSQKTVLGSTMSKEAYEALAQAIKENETITKNLAATITTDLAPAMKVGTESVEEMGDTLENTMDDVMLDLDSTIKQGMANVITNIAEGIGEMIATINQGGSVSMEDFGKNIILAVADFGKQLGALMITTGIAALAFEKMALNPVGLIIAGAALVAAASAVSSLMSKSGEAMGGGATSTRSSSSYRAPRGGGNQYALDYTLRGEDIRVSYIKTTKNQNRIR